MLENPSPFSGVGRTQSNRATTASDEDRKSELALSVSLLGGDATMFELSGRINASWSERFTTSSETQMCSVTNSLCHPKISPRVHFT
jgi:hypothetical protein